MQETNNQRDKNDGDRKEYNAKFQELVNQYQEPLYWHIRKIVVRHQDADDVLQEVFIKVWRKLHTFKGQAALSTWLYRIATNEALNFLNREKRKSLISGEDVTKMLMNKLDTDPYFSGSDIDKKLHKAVLKLPEQQRLVFNMKYFDDMKYEDIAKILGKSEGALKASYHHAVKKIKEALRADTL